MTEPQWRDLAAGLAMIGLLASGERGTLLAQESYKYADDLLEAKYFDSEGNEMGIVSVRKRKSRVQKQETT